MTREEGRERGRGVCFPKTTPRSLVALRRGKLRPPGTAATPSNCGEFLKAAGHQAAHRKVPVAAGRDRGYGNSAGGLDNLQPTPKPSPPPGVVRRQLND
jgi:hypothetical protein